MATWKNVLEYSSNSEDDDPDFMPSKKEERKLSRDKMCNNSPDPKWSTHKEKPSLLIEYKKQIEVWEDFQKAALQEAKKYYPDCNACSPQYNRTDETVTAPGTSSSSSGTNKLKESSFHVGKTVSFHKERKSNFGPGDGDKPGIESVLKSIKKKKLKKVNTLEMSSDTWKKFKSSENIEKELKSYNMGKGGYIERQRFLEVCDTKEFEAERKVRMTKRRKSVL